MKYTAIVIDTISYPHKVIGVFESKKDAKEYASFLSETKYEVSLVPYFRYQGFSQECMMEDANEQD